MSRCNDLDKSPYLYYLSDTARVWYKHSETRTKWFTRRKIHYTKWLFLKFKFSIEISLNFVPVGVIDNDNNDNNDSNDDNNNNDNNDDDDDDDDDLVSIGDKPLLEPRMTNFCYTLWHHLTTIS